MLAMFHIIQRNDARVSRSGKTLTTRGEGNRADGLCQAYTQASTPPLASYPATPCPKVSREAVLTRERINHPARIIVEHVHRATLVPARRQPPVHAQIHRHGEAAATPRARLVRLDLFLARQVPDVDPPVAGRAGEVPFVGAQGQGPDVAPSRLGGGDLPLQLPFVAAGLEVPDLDLPTEPDACSDVA